MQCVNVMIKRVCNVFRFFICMLDFYSVRYKIWIDRIITFLGGMEESSYFSGCFFFCQFSEKDKMKTVLTHVFWNFFPSSGYKFLSSGILKNPCTKYSNRSRNWQKTKKDQSISNRCEINIRFIDNKKYRAVQTQQMNNCRVIYFI